MLKKYFQQALIWGMVAASPGLSMADLVDPTRPPSLDSLNKGMYDLSEILISPHNKIAVLGGHTFHEGETFQGITVVEIRANEVELKGAHGQMKLELFKSSLSPSPAR
jgi:hypothetical protein